MLQAFILFCQIMFLISIFSLVTGLFKPVLVLWFLDRMNRLKVIKVYGGLGLVWLLIWLLLNHF
ncbi:hypothetical protein [Cecembia rubra]|uniref:LysE type translocator n=1 Tax=Cecembia rubra TaxID=1485585 RepID=A0A2P8E4L3_9BACT|nr:hypothetical protein [Cecembia rubra]PSL04418.1 hypothetical protein CLV48_105162 [Cecembia rubra]